MIITHHTCLQSRNNDRCSPSLLPLVSATAPEVFIAHSEPGDVLLQHPLLLLAVDAGQVHVVVPAELLRLEPVSLGEPIIRINNDNSVVYTLKNSPI